jgi:uncharacterized protein
MLGCNHLGQVYQNGLGVPRDIKQARTLYSQACDKGLQPACENLRKLP